MFIIEASRRASRVAVERIRDAFIEFDHVAFKAVDIAAEDAYQVIHEGPRRFVLAVNDPTLQSEEERTYDCGD